MFAEEIKSSKFTPCKNKVPAQIKGNIAKQVIKLRIIFLFLVIPATRNKKIA